MNTVRKVIIKLPALLQNLALLDEPINRLLTQPNLVVSDNDIYNVRLAVQELCANIIKHAYAGEKGTITLALEINPATGQFAIATQDKGKHHFDWQMWTPPDLEQHRVHGLGLWLILRTMDKVVYEALPTSHQWRLHKIFQPASLPTTIPATLGTTPQQAG